MKIEKNDITPLNLSETNNLITLDLDENIQKHVKIPPLNWMVLQSTPFSDSLPDLPEKWPKPTFSDNISGIDGLTMGIVYPFSDSQPAIHLSYEKMNLLIITDSLLNVLISDTNKPVLFKEKFDIIITTNADKKQILAIRDILRPQYFINADTSIHPDDTISSLSNILYPGSTVFSYTIFRNIRKKLRIQER